MRDVFIARQEILDRDLHVFGYELLYRSGNTTEAMVRNGDLATSSVIVNAFLEIGIESIVGPRLAFMNFTRNFLVGQDMFAFPRDRIVVEVLEDVLPATDIIGALDDLRERGYRLALDDFVYREDLVPLIERAHIVKLDLMAFDETELRRHVELLRPFGVELVAEKVETHEEYELCHELGFDYFQGYHFTRPKIITQRRLAANQANTVELMAQLFRPGTTTADVEPIIRRDLALTVKLLRYINSAFYGLRSKVASIRQAIVLLGLRNIRSWASVILMAGVSDKPDALMVTALCRAKMCELLAEHHPDRDQSYFMAGMFSVLDALMDTEMSAVLEDLPVSDEIRLALLEQHGQIGEILAEVIAYERGEWHQLTTSERSVDELRNAYLGAICWADECVSSVDAASSSDESAAA